MTIQENNPSELFAGEETTFAADSTLAAKELSRRTFLKGSSLAAASMVISSMVMGAMTGCTKLSFTNGAAPVMSFTNLTERDDGHLEADVISMMEERAFQAIVPLPDSNLADLELAVDEDRVVWTLSRTEVPFDETLFPTQQRGGMLRDWKTVATEAQPETELFFDIATRAEEIEGVPSLLVTFSSRTLYGYDGLDAREEALTVGSFLDYSGIYWLGCTLDGVELDAIEVPFLPYDYFRTQDELDREIDELVAQANDHGLYAEKQVIGTSAGDRPINAVILAGSKAYVDEYLELARRMEAEPAKVQEEVRNGSLSYRVPVVYNNVHPNEITGSDSIIELMRLTMGEKPIEYFRVTGLTPEGQKRLAQEMEEDRTVWSALVADKCTGIGYLQGNGTRNPADENPDQTTNMTDEEFRSYYEVETAQCDPASLLEDVILIFVPSENPDGRALQVRTNGNGFDLNRDNTYQTQPETRAMTSFLARWNPLSLHEIHGNLTQFQIEPCTPTHDPNNEYDLFVDTCIQQGEAFAAAAIANNATLNSAQIPLRDYLKRAEDGSVSWEMPWDDMTSSYTPQYAMLHGSNAYTVELPWGSQDAVDAATYGMLGNACFVAENKDRMFLNQLERYRRGVENIDADEIRPYYVDQNDTPGADADNFRPRFPENDNFFPEYFIIPLSADRQGNRAAAREMVEYLLRNGIAVDTLTEDISLENNAFRAAVELRAGDIVVDMHQAKRNVANTVLYPNLVVANWTKLYSEPVTNFPNFRGFDMVMLTTPGALPDDKLSRISEAPVLDSSLVGDGAAVLVSNNGVEAIAAVNEALARGESVGLVTEGAHRGDFIMKADAYQTLAESYVIEGTATDEPPTAQRIADNITLHVSRAGEEFMTYADGTAYGLKGYRSYETPPYNWDRFAFGAQMGFTLVDDPGSASILVGCCPLDEEELTAVRNGKPCIAYSQDALGSLRDGGLPIEIDTMAEGMYDALTTVSFVTEHLVSAPYQARKDHLFYGHGGSFITAMPEKAQVILKTTSDEFIEGFIDENHRARYKNTVQAIAYQDDGWNLVLFANSMTNKAHQLHEYRYLALAVYSNFLDGAFSLD